VPSCTFRVGDKNGKKKIILKLHAVDRIFGFTYIKFLLIFANFEDSDKILSITVKVKILTNWPIYTYIFPSATSKKVLPDKGKGCFKCRGKNKRPPCVTFYFESDGVNNRVGLLGIKNN
jgi:hypothetical protein